MAFVTRDFPQKVFENLEEYNNYLKLRESIIDKLKKDVKEKTYSLVKVTNVIKYNSPLLQILTYLLQRIGYDNNHQYLTQDNQHK